jgi:outer membrane cobalamin receptor
MSMSVTFPAPRQRRFAALWFGALWLGTSCTWGGEADNPYLDLSLEDLLDVQVTSVSRKEQRPAEAAAAVYVVSRDDIRRSGALSVPEVLRMVPGMNMARIDANKWAVSARGQNGLWANKLLVLLDGRSVYTPLFAGVWWDVQDPVLEDIERIEVVRGPGATLWGANAVNGVINIITRSARDTQGGLLSAGYGTEDPGFAALRYGGALGEDGHYRLYAKTLRRDDSGDTHFSLPFRFDNSLAGDSYGLELNADWRPHATVCASWPPTVSWRRHSTPPPGPWRTS